MNCLNHAELNKENCKMCASTAVMVFLSKLGLVEETLNEKQFIY